MSDDLRVRERWFSERLQTDITVVRWGVVGTPVPQWDHQWHTWRQMLPQYLRELT